MVSGTLTPPMRKSAHAWGTRQFGLCYLFCTMMKWLATFGVVLGVIVSVAYDQHHTRQKYQAQAQADCIALAISVEEKHSCEKEAQSRKDYSPWWYMLVAWPEGITTWAVIATGFAITYQSVETAKAAKATEVAAIAAKDGVAVTMNAERAWIIDEAVSVAFLPSPVTGYFTLTNRGRILECPA